MGSKQSNTVHRETCSSASALNPMVRSALSAELRELLCQAAGGSPDVPSGWARLQRDAELMLRSAVSDALGRSELRITGVYVLASRPFVQLSSPDRVVHGIYRRAVACARHTCQVCGRAGRVWEELSQFRVLCPRCAAPHAITADLDALEQVRAQRRQPSDTVPVAEIPPRLLAAITAALATAEGVDGANDRTERNTRRRTTINREEFERWCDWLFALRHSAKFEEAITSVS
jgi:hypothetical protein